jgi:PST family polysaccharide transporter
LLVASGWGLKEAVVAKGVFDRGQPLIQFASFFSTAISLSIVPAIAEAKAKSEDGTAKERALLALRLTWMLGLPASVGLAVIALPANVMLFKDASGSDTLAILAFAAFFSTLGHASTGILQGLSRVYLPALTLIAGVIVKLSLNLLLVPLWDIRGAAVSTVIAYGCATLLNLLALKRELDLPLKSETALKTVWAVLWMAAAVFGTMMGIRTLIVDWVDYRTTMMVTSLVSVFVGAVTYFWALFRFGVLTRTDLEKVPKLKKRLLPILDKWRLLRS